MDVVGDNKIPGWVRIGDESITVINQYETQEYKDYLKTFRNWYLKGYIKKDSAMMKDHLPNRQALRIASLYSHGYPDTVDMPELVNSNTIENSPPESKAYAYTKRFTEPFILANSLSSAVTAVCASSKNPEKAMQLVELLNTNDELYHLICFGQEGIDYFAGRPW